MISIDIGKRNTAIAILRNGVVESVRLLSLGAPRRGESVVTHTVKTLIGVVNEYTDKDGGCPISGAVVERQVSTNVCAMNIMYCLATIFEMRGVPVTIFDPKRKFSDQERLPSLFGVCTDKKRHKKAVVECVLGDLSSEIIPDTVRDQIRDMDKQDDVCDAIIQGLVTHWAVTHWSVVDD